MWEGIWLRLECDARRRSGGSAACYDDTGHQMKFRGRSAALAIFLLPQTGVAQSWRLDRRVALELQQSGAQQETESAVLYFETGALPQDRMSTFAALIEKGLKDIASFLKVPLPNERKIRYFISSEFATSHSQGRSIYLPLERVANQSAPYLHETVHAIVPCPNCPLWFSEGFASFVQSYVSEHMGGYDGIIFARRGNRGIDRDALRWLANERGQAVLPFIGKPEEPPQIAEDRNNVAAPFYVMAQSLVKHMVENTDIDTLRKVMDDAGFEHALEQMTGKTSEQWKQTWLTRIHN
jgi:hypothetical protein